MKRLTKNQQATNCLLALSLWREVSPNEVSKDLHQFRCGSHACFGGHLATWPEFQAMGVGVDPVDGRPQIAGLSPPYEVSHPYELSKHLFGDEFLFAIKGYRHDEENGMTDYDAVVYRLERQIEELSS